MNTGETRKDWAELRRKTSADRAKAGRDRTGLRNFRRVRRAIGELGMRTLLPLLVRALCATWRLREIDAANREACTDDRGALMTLWHGRMLAALPSARDRGHQVLVSPSRDGDLIARLLRSYGYGVIRGSSSRGGARAMREMSTQLTRGKSVVITPDGPRGPRHNMNIGPACLARETGLPVLCLGVAADRAWRLKSWDRFTIPKPFARVAIAYGAPIKVDADASDRRLEEITEQIRGTLLAQEERAFADLGVEMDF